MNTVAMRSERSTAMAAATQTRKPKNNYEAFIKPLISKHLIY
jgi:hypothetical protein